MNPFAALKWQRRPPWLTHTVCGNVGLDGDTTQTYGDYTDSGGTCVQVSCDDCDEACPGDLDGNGEVGVDDLLILVAAWGSCG